MDRFDVLIVGGGHGGAQAAIALRNAGFAGSIAIVGREHELPYERPPLSKDYLAREKPFERLLLRPEAYWADKAITMLLGQTVVNVDAQAHRVSTEQGASIEYGQLIWATGGDPRPLSCPGADLAGIHAIRNREDVDQLMAELDGGSRKAAIIGGGYIGLEAAAVLSKLGCSVTLLEALPRVLSRVAGEVLSAFYQQEHAAHGIELHTGVAVEQLEGRDGRVCGVRMGDGSLIDADLVIVGIGIIPCVAPLLEAGAKGGNGVLVDELCRTSLPDIFAIGDCAAHSSQFADGAVIRLESVQNANDMATTVAKAICGDPQPYGATPWFWSNQYDLKLQTVGLSSGHDTVVIRGDPSTRSFAAIYLKDGSVIALDCVNSVKDYAQGRKLVEQRTRATPQDLADINRPLKELAVSA